jgi:MauM/NapG family ferredoxin protein
VSQGFFFILFLFLLIETRLPSEIQLTYSPDLINEQDLRLEMPVTFFFELDPLVWISSLLSGHTWIQGAYWAIGILLLTLFLGRLFCGFICPFGTLHHIFGWIRPHLKGDRMIRANRKSKSQSIKYFILVAILVSCLLGLNFAGLLDPISFLFRSVALAFIPGMGYALREVFDLLAGTDLRIINQLGYGAEVLLSPVFGYEPVAFRTGWFIGICFLVILFLNRIRPRFWCRTLCPLGALLGVCTRFSVLRLDKDQEKCTNCKLCEKGCQGAATPIPGKVWENAECITCFNCFKVCPEEALAFRLRFAFKPNQKPDMGRRAVLTGLFAGITLPFLGRLDGQIDKVADPRLIRPPGALEEKKFLTLCQRCGLCMKACPTNVINPTLAEAGMGGFWTPHLIMNQGYCEYTCTLCGSVCPTGALKEITLKEKIETPIRIGSAYVDRGRCLPWSGNAPCIVCEEHCPTAPKAIYLKKDVVQRSDGSKLEVQLPYVDLKQCIGCGICENKCPVRGKAAILVISAGESRSVENQILLL